MRYHRCHTPTHSHTHSTLTQFPHSFPYDTHINKQQQQQNNVSFTCHPPYGSVLRLRDVTRSDPHLGTGEDMCGVWGEDENWGPKVPQLWTGTKIVKFWHSPEWRHILVDVVYIVYYIVVVCISIYRWCRLYILLAGDFHVNLMLCVYIICGPAKMLLLFLLSVKLFYWLLNFLFSGLILLQFHVRYSSIALLRLASCIWRHIWRHAFDVTIRCNFTCSTFLDEVFYWRLFWYTLYL